MHFLLSLRDAASQGVLFGIMTLGVYISFQILDHPDMSVDGTFVLGGAISTVFVTKWGLNPIIAVIFSMIFGMMAGLFTGVLHTKFKIPAVLSGILTMLSLYSINLRIMGGPNRSYLDEHKTMISMIIEKINISRNAAGLIVGSIFAVGAVFILYWFFGTEIGSAIRGTGDNENMVRALGINTDSTRILGLLISNGLVALSGGLISQYQRYADVNMGIGVIAEGLVAIMIAQVFINPERSFLTKLFAVIASSVAYRFIISVALNIGLKSEDMKLLTSVIVIITLIIPIFKNNWLPTFLSKKEHQKKYGEGGEKNA